MMPESKPLPLGATKKFDQDSEEEDDENDDGMSDLRRSMPGQPTVQVAKAQISMI